MSKANERERLRELAIDALPAGIVVVDSSLAVAIANAAARRLFGLSEADIGRAFEDLESIFHPVELRSALENVAKEQRPLVLEQVAWPGGPDMVDCFEIYVVPVTGDAADTLGVALMFIDTTLSRRLQEELERSNREVETAYRQLQSTIEELETTTESVLSTNTELEVMNAELRSGRDELQAINRELRLRTGQLDEVNDFLQAILTSQPGGLVIIDRDMRISVWNDTSAELWGLRPEEAPGQHLLNLEIGLPVEELRRPIQAILSGDSDGETVELAATSRRGREIRCRVSLRPLINRDGTIRGVIILMEEVAD